MGDLSLYPSANEWAMMKDQAMKVVKSGMLPPSIKTPEQAVTVMLKGRELGIPAMQAFSSINVIQGKPTLSAELMLSLVLKNIPSAQYEIVETTDEKCVIEASRSPQAKKTRFEFNLEDAKRAKLYPGAPNSSWAKYPRAMLRNRCVSEMCRSIFPDALSGCVYTPEELGAQVDEDGHVIDVTPHGQGAKNNPNSPQEKGKTVNGLSHSNVSQKPSPASDYEDYVIPIGTFKGKKIKELSDNDLSDYREKILVWSMEQSKEIPPDVLDLLDIMLKVVKQRFDNMITEGTKCFGKNTSTSQSIQSDNESDSKSMNTTLTTSSQP